MYLFYACSCCGYYNRDFSTWRILTMNNVVLIIIAIAAIFVIDIVFDDVLSPTAKSIVTLLTILFFALIYFCGQHAASSGAARLHKLGEQLDTEQQSQAVETEKQPNHKK